MTPQEIASLVRNIPSKSDTYGRMICDDAADLIESLAAELAEVKLTHRTEHCEAADYDCVELGRLRKELAQVKRERDAAVKDFECCIANGDDSICKYCKYRDTVAEEHCMDCDGDGFKWRGVQEGEKHEEV